MSSSSFRRGTSHLPSATDLIHDATDMNESLLASLLLVMSHNASTSSISKIPTKIAAPSLHLPAEETVDTATAAAAVATVAAATEVSTLGWAARAARARL